MHSLSVILLAVWLILFGAINATWVTMQAHTFGVLTVIVGIAILVVEFFVWRGEGRRVV